jgi:molybdopterin molybdotransferase
VRAIAADPITNRGSRRGYLRVSLTLDSGRWLARLTGDQGSGILRSMVAADGLAVVQPDTKIERGREVEVILIRELSR